MEVDVMDLDFESLDFSRSYDSARYQRGKELYRKEKVTIKHVEDEGNNKYKVEAKVRGSYDTYGTSLQIEDEIIKKCTCTCEDFYKGYICKHVIATSMEVIDPHEASTREGRLKILREQQEEIKKRLEEERRIQQELQRKEMYEKKYRQVLDLIDSYKSKNEVNKHNVLNLKDLYENVKEQNENSEPSLMKGIKLECAVEAVDDETLKVGFKVGQTRMYVLNNISDFYEAYKNQTPLYYGKQLNFVPKRENFVFESQGLLDFIIKYAEMLEYNKRINEYSRYSTGSNKELYVMGDDIEEILKLCDGKVYVDSYYEGKTMYCTTNEKIELKYILKKETIIVHYGYWYEKKQEESEEYVLRLNLDKYGMLISNKNLYIFHKNKIYTIEKDEETIKKINLFRDRDRILIPEDRLEEFQQFVFPKMKHLEIEEDIKNVVKDGTVVDKLASKMLLDVDDYGNILLELKFCYGDLEFNILDKNHTKYVEKNGIVRDIPQETAIVKNLFADGFELESGSKNFVMKDENSVYNLLLYKIADYMNDFEVLATDKLKNKQIRQPKISNIGIKVDNGLLELDISKINVDIEELKNVLKDYTIKKKYHKLKNGDFLDLTQNQDLDLLEDLTSTLDVDYTKVKNGIVRLPVNRSIYLEKIVGKNANVSKNKDYVEIIDNIGNPENSFDEIKVDKEFEDKLREYQKVGYKWLKTLEKYKFGGILADDMGLGKTLQVIAVLKDELANKSNNPSIVVCPSTLALNWKSEVEKWCKDIKVLIINGTADERKEKIDNYNDYNLVITSYDLLKRDVANYEDKYFKYIIADEAQYIKNSNTQNATSLKSLKGEVKFALTGTPIENSIAELWSIFDFIMPGYLYNYNKFKKKFEEPIVKGEDKESLAKFKKLISPFVLRRVKSDVLTELPEKSITIMKNEMEKEQEKIYLSYLAQTKQQVAEEINGNGFEKSKFKILMLLTRLRQICCHPSLFIENYKGDCGKLNQCMDILSDAIEAGHKVLLFSSYTSMFDIIEKELNKQNIKYFKLVGNTPVNTRVDMVEEFNKTEDVKVFLISLKAGGTGLNLTSADVVIHYDPWWNISGENQATDRAYRIGQKNSVQVYKLITSNSIEEKINKMQERKEKLSKDILSTEETFISSLSKEEILDLFA